MKNRYIKKTCCFFIMVFTILTSKDTFSCDIKGHLRIFNHIKSDSFPDLKLKLEIFRDNSSSKSLHEYTLIDTDKFKDICWKEAIEKNHLTRNIQASGIDISLMVQGIDYKIASCAVSTLEAGIAYGRVTDCMKTYKTYIKNKKFNVKISSDCSHKIRKETCSMHVNLVK